MMKQSLCSTTLTACPPPDISTLPPRVDRKTAAELVTRHFFPIGARTLEVWPLAWRLVNGKAVCETLDLFAMAQAKLDAAPPLLSTLRKIPTAA